LELAKAFAAFGHQGHRHADAAADCCHAADALANTLEVAPQTQLLVFVFFLFQAACVSLQEQ
jgi:hypothetical protein